MDLLILGVGGHGRVVSEVAKALGIYDRIVFLDDDYCKNDKCCKDNQMTEIIGRLSD